ncbi:MAG TPA: YncE family protein, partial [Pyrinomonadaceae bacterium]|nr:YncE family protein [Pyrinomonadaceae bacterium]
MRTADARTRQTKRLCNALVTALAQAFILSTCAVVAVAQSVKPEVSSRALIENSGANAPVANKSDAARPAPQRFEREGVRVEFSVEALAGDKAQAGALAAGSDAVARFRITDANSGQPLTGLRPNAWLSSRRDGRQPSEGECKDKIRSFMGGLLSVRADVDLNSYFVLALNHDNTVSVINPHVAFSRTKLESLVVLPGAGADWVLSKDKQFLYVTLPEQSAVAVVNTITRKLVSTIPVGEKTRPTRVALDPDGRFAWVGLDGSPRVAVIDTEARKLAAEVAVGAGLHQIAFTDDNRLAFVTNSEADTLSVVDAQNFKKLSDIPVGRTPVPVAYSRTGRHVYVASANAAHVSVIDPASRRVVASVPVKRGVVALRFEPAGRYAFAVNQVESTVSVIDAATNSVVATSGVVKGPDQVTFTRNYAYVRGTGSEKFSLIELSELSKGKVAPVDVQAGQKPPSALPGEIGVADMIAPTPEGNAAMIANAPDALLYYYVEGMMAPMGTFSNYKRRPRALMVLDRSLSE